MFDNFSKRCQQSALSKSCQQLVNLSEQSFLVNNGNIPKWEKTLEQIRLQPSGNLSQKMGYLNIDAINTDEIQLEVALKQLMPWRKGPYQIGNLVLESEWRSDMKWHRVLPHIKPLQGKTVLDVGAGNGYFSYLMAIAGARIVLGIEPFLLFNYQFQAIRILIKNPPNAFVLPLKLEQIPSTSVFDSIFSMGVLYHQKDPIAHLQQLKSMLAKSGELILETLIIDEKHGAQIIPKARYAKMRNVWCLPGVRTLKTWLLEAGFSQIRLVDVNQTTFGVYGEQRTTHWIGEGAKSLQDFLDPNNSNLTIEGLPAPKRTIFICTQN